MITRYTILAQYFWMRVSSQNLLRISRIFSMLSGKVSLVPYIYTIQYTGQHTTTCSYFSFSSNTSSFLAFSGTSLFDDKSIFTILSTKVFFPNMNECEFFLLICIVENKSVYCMFNCLLMNGVLALLMQIL